MLLSWRGGEADEAIQNPRLTLQFTRDGHPIPCHTRGSPRSGDQVPESVRIFLSTVSNEFRAYREQLRTDLTRHNVEVKVQEDFVDLGGETLDKLDAYIKACDAVVHLVGDMTGAPALDP